MTYFLTHKQKQTAEKGRALAMQKYQRLSDSYDELVREHFYLKEQYEKLQTNYDVLAKFHMPKITQAIADAILSRMQETNKRPKVRKQ